MKISRKLCSVFLAVTMLFLTAMPASAVKPSQRNVQQFMDVFDQMYRPYEELEKVYLSSLESLLDYTNDPTAAHRKALQELLVQNCLTLSRMEFPGYISDAKAEKFMQQKALSKPDLKAMANSLESFRDLDLDALELYIYELDLIGKDQIDFSILVHHISKRLELEKMFLENNFYACNEFFMPLKGDELAYVKETLAARYPTLCPKSFTWQSDMKKLLRLEDELTKRENELAAQYTSSTKGA